MLKPHWRIKPLDVGALLVPLLLFAGVVALAEFVFQDPERHLREEHIAALTALAERPPDSLTLTDGATIWVITDPLDIREFLHLLIDPEVVHYHHSHPEAGIELRFADRTRTYTLSPDSQVPDEYWLELDTGTDPGPTLKLFRSQVLTSWLAQHAIRPR